MEMIFGQVDGFLASLFFAHAPPDYDLLWLLDVPCADCNHVIQIRDVDEHMESCEKLRVVGLPPPKNSQLLLPEFHQKLHELKQGM